MGALSGASVPPGASSHRGRRAHARFLVLAASSLCVLAAAALAWRVFGGRLVAAAAENRSGRLARLLLEPDEPLPKALARVERLYLSAVVIAALAYVALLLGYALWHWRGPRLAKVLAFVALWVAVELAVAPRMAAPWGLGEFYFVRDVDHRPPITGGQFNADSLRSRHQPADFRPEGWSFVFLGDSFTYGAHLALDESFPVLVERALQAAWPAEDVKVANFGWSSSSPLLSWRRLVEAGEHYHPDWVALFVDMTDFHDDLRYESMLARRGVFWWSDKTPVLLKLLKRSSPTGFEGLMRLLNPELPAERFFMSLAPLEETRADMLPLVENVAKIHAWCEERGARFALFVLPRNYQYSERESPKSWERDRYVALGPHANEPFRFFEELAPALPYPVYSLLPDFQATDVFPTCLPNDPHWNPAGARVAAEAIARYLLPEVEAWASAR